MFVQAYKYFIKMIENILTLLDTLKNDPKNLGDLSKVALGRNKLPMTIKEGLELTRYR